MFCLRLSSLLRYNRSQFSLQNIYSSFRRLTEEFSGAATVPFSQEITKVLMSRVNENDVEIKPDGTAAVE